MPFSQIELPEVHSPANAIIVANQIAPPRRSGGLNELLLDLLLISAADNSFPPTKHKMEIFVPRNSVICPYNKTVPESEITRLQDRPVA
ncbi:hypothetical protein D3H35_05745 [Cohnella faecalis]|uniref:Uncharacterized protein n=1 Tax=Cohnella faecalis TaxID=2315694 RepID=A0A398CXK3_9BACL|nr:hypothetical protein D3H35_05745 [Cohnella faecalis]